MSNLLRALTVLALALAMTAPAAAGDPVRITITGVDPSGFPTVRLVASITDAAGRPIDKVSATDIIVSEDGRAQRSSLERVGEQQPVALVLALDISGSMAGKPLADAKAALGTLVASLGPDDSAALITFDANVHVAQPLTKDKTLVRAAINAAAANGNTAIFDAANSAIDMLASTDAQARRAIVLLTDGVDNSSHVSLAAVAQRMATQPYPLYVVGLGTSLDNGVLKTLGSSGTGGGLYVAPTSTQLASIYSSLAQQIRVQYMLSYRSDTSSAPDGTPLSVTLQYTQAGTVLGSARVTFVVPAGHGVTAAPSTALRIPSTVKAPIDAGGSIDPVLLGLLGSASALCLLLWVSTLAESRGFALLERSRLARYGGATAAAEPRRSLWSRIVRPAALRAAAPFGRWVPGSAVEGTRRTLAQSGRAIDLTAAEFLGIRIGLGFLCAVLFAFIAVFVQPDLIFVGMLGVIGLMFGYLLPGMWLSRTVRARQHRILRALPSALDMLALSAGAGMTLDGALGQVAQRWRGPLSDEFRLVLTEFNMGRDRKAALRALGDRTGVTEVARFANAIIQADALGTPITRVLQEQAAEMRTRRRQRAEEAARKAPVKMLFPMVGLIFPALFLVILGPAVPRFMDLFQQVH